MEIRKNQMKENMCIPWRGYRKMLDKKMQLCYDAKAVKKIIKKSKKLEKSSWQDKKDMIYCQSCSKQADIILRLRALGIWKSGGENCKKDFQILKKSSWQTTNRMILCESCFNRQPTISFKGSFFLGEIKKQNLDNLIMKQPWNFQKKVSKNVWEITHP